MTSSSCLSDAYSAKHAQLNSNSAWCPVKNFTTNGEFLQIVFTSLKQLKRIQIAGEANAEVNQTVRRVTKYQLQISNDGVHFHDFKQVIVSHKQMYRGLKPKWGGKRCVTDTNDVCKGD